MRTKIKAFIALVSIGLISFGALYPTLAKAAIPDNIVAHWNMDETNGNRADAVGSNTLIPSTTGGYTTGKIGNAFATTGSSSGNLNISDNATLSTGNIDYTIASWVKFNSVSGNQGVVMKYQSSTSEKEYGIFLTASKLRYIIASSSGTTVSVDSPTISANTWYFVVAWLDSDAKTLNIQVNNGAVASIARGTVAPQDGTGALTVGSYNGTNYLNGAVDSVSLWKRLLTPTERTQLYNDGAGLDYPFTVTESSAPTEPLNLSTQIVNSGEVNLAWDLPASSGNEAITDYAIEYKQSSDSVWSTFADGTSDNLYGTVTGLSNGTSYDFRVSATNVIGTGPVSSTATVTPRAGAIALTSPKAYQVYQRDGSDQADIVISGTYTGSPSSIEASWNGGSYQTISVSPTGGTYSGTLSDQTAGQATLDVRFVNDTNVSTSRQYVGIGDVYVIAGQSNASGRSANNQFYSHGSLKASLFSNNDTWSELQDPTDDNTGQVDAVSEDSQVNKGSFWPLLATKIMAQENVPVAFIPTAKGGSIIYQWQKSSPSAITNTDTTPFSSCSSTAAASGLYKSMNRRIGLVTGGVKAVLFVQGETDAINELGGGDYKNYLRCFADNVHDDFGVKTVAAQIGYDNNPSASATDTAVNDIRLAQQQLWDENGNVLAGPVLYDIETGDGVHFTSNDALSTVASRFWASLDNIYYGGPDGRGPRFATALHNAAKTYVDVTFDDDSLPLTPASSVEGFSVKDDDVDATITSVSRITNGTFRITLANAASGTLTVSLASGNSDGYQRDVPTDNSAEGLPAEPFIDQEVAAIPPLSAPTSVSATAGNAQATVSFAAPAQTGESAITSYTVTSSPGGIIATGSTSPIAVTGLTNGTNYTFTVTASNSEGEGPASSPSASVTPTEPPFDPDGDADGIDTEVEELAPNGGDANDDNQRDSEQANVASFVNEVTGEYVSLAVNPDGDADGIDTEVEELAPNGGDANDDNQRDSEQANVASFVNEVTGEYVSLAVNPECAITQATTVTETGLSSSDANYSYSFGLLDFIIECSTATVHQYFFNSTDQQLDIRKFMNNTYTSVSGATIENIEINGTPAIHATYTLHDGSELDTDATVNGIISDTAGPAILDKQTSETPSNNKLRPSSHAPTGINALHISILALAALSSSITLLTILRTRSRKS